jgi:hypothetical protein
MAAVAPTTARATSTAPTPALARRWVTPARVFFLVVVALLYVGWRTPTERYITPRSGVGYLLGIVGGSLMVLLLLYSARKRFRWLAFLGSVNRWFEVHMVFGVLGPLCILFHSNFSLGATNSNVAFFSMLTVAGSGLVGRYLYSHIHFGLYGRKKSLSELKASADRLQSLGQNIPFLPDLMTRLEGAERTILATGPNLPILELVKPLFVTARVLLARWKLRGYVRRALRASARTSPLMSSERRRLQRTAMRFAATRLRATREVAEFEVYQRLFGLWHVLHLPLIFMLFIAGVVHVVAVHVY